jgi:hypothetical protein
MSSHRSETVHPDELTTAAYLDGALGRPERESFESHLADCGACRAGLVLLRSARADAEEQPPAELLAKAREAGRSKKHLPPLARPGSLAAVAAGLLILVLAAWLMVGRLHLGGESPYREEQAAQFESLSPRAGNSVAREALVFEWSGIPGADRYELVVLDPEGRTLLTMTASAEETRAVWPRGTQTPLPGPLVWKVRAMKLDRVVAESAPVPIVVRP